MGITKRRLSSRQLLQLINAVDEPVTNLDSDLETIASLTPSQDQLLRFDGVNWIADFIKNSDLPVNNVEAGNYGDVTQFPRITVDTTGRITEVQLIPLVVTSAGGTLDVTAILSVGNGLVTAPSLPFSSDLDTGIYRIGENRFGIATGGVLRAEVNNTQVLIPGTTSSTSTTTGALVVGGGGGFAGTVTANSFSGSGSALTNLSASNLTTGTIANARISGAYTNFSDITGTGTFTGKDFIATNVGYFHADANSYNKKYLSLNLYFSPTGSTYRHQQTGYGSVLENLTDTGEFRLRTTTASNTAGSGSSLINLLTYNPTTGVTSLGGTTLDFPGSIPGGIGIGTAARSSTAGIVIEETYNANGTRYGIQNTVTLDDTIALTGARTSFGFYSRIDSNLSSAKVNGFRQDIYGGWIYARNGVNSDGDTGVKHIYGCYNLAENNSATGVIPPLMIGAYNRAMVSGTLGVTSSRASNNYVQIYNAATITDANGSFNLVQTSHVGSVIRTAYGTFNNITNISGSIPTAYGVYNIFEGTIGTKWGIYSNGDEKNYLTGNLGLGIDPVSYKLDVSGTARISGQTLFSATTSSTSTTTGALVVSGGGGFAGNVYVGGIINGNGSGLTALNASNVSTGRMSYLRFNPCEYTLPDATAAIADGTFSLMATTIAAGYPIEGGHLLTGVFGASRGIQILNSFDGISVYFRGRHPSFETGWSSWRQAILSLRDGGSGVFTSTGGTGWASNPTGTLTRTTFATSTVTLVQLAERVAALIKDLRDRGVIGA